MRTSEQYFFLRRMQIQLPETTTFSYNLLSRLIDIVHWLLLYVLWDFRCMSCLHSFRWIIMNTLNSHSTYGCGAWRYVWWYLWQIFDNFNCSTVSNWFSLQLVRYSLLDPLVHVQCSVFYVELFACHQL